MDADAVLVEAVMVVRLDFEVGTSVERRLFVSFGGMLVVEAVLRKVLRVCRDTYAC